MPKVLLSLLLTIIIIPIGLFLFGSIIKFVTTINENKRQAFRLTKAFGDCELKCVCVEDIEEGNNKLTFYILEKGAEQDSTKKMKNLMEDLMIGDSFFYKTPKEKHRLFVRAHKILDQMPYGHIDIDHTHETTEKFMSIREEDRVRRIDEKNEKYDLDNSEAIKKYVEDTDVRIVCHEKKGETSFELDEYYYYLYVDYGNNQKTEYVDLFGYPKKQKERGDKRARRFLLMLGKSVVLEDSPISFNDFYATNGEEIKGVWEITSELSREEDDDCFYAESTIDFLADIDARIVCHELNVDEKPDYKGAYYYILYVGNDLSSMKYYYLFHYPKYRKKYGEKRAYSFLKRINKEPIVEYSSISFGDFKEANSDNYDEIWFLDDNIGN